MHKKAASDNNHAVNEVEQEEIELQQESVVEGAAPTEASRIEELEQEVEELKNTVLRLMADNENIRKRFAKEIDESSSYAIQGFAKDIVEILENLNRAIDNIPQNAIEADGALKLFADGVIMTKKILEDAFNKYSISRIYPLLEKFDHNYHQAIGQLVDAEKEPNTVLQVIQAGYKIKDRLLKPALVMVNKA